MNMCGASSLVVTEAPIRGSEPRGFWLFPCSLTKYCSCPSSGSNTKYLFCQPWIRLVYLLRTPSSCLLRACCCCCKFMLFPSTVARLPPAPAEPPREPEPGLCDPGRPPGFLDDELPRRSAEEEFVLLVPGCGLQSVLSILATGRHTAGGGGGAGREGRRGEERNGPEAAAEEIFSKA